MMCDITNFLFHMTIMYSHIFQNPYLFFIHTEIK
jgi:hypothetical protein